MFKKNKKWNKVVVVDDIIGAEAPRLYTYTDNKAFLFYPMTFNVFFYYDSNIGSFTHRDHVLKLCLLTVIIWYDDNIIMFDWLMKTDLMANTMIILMVNWLIPLYYIKY